MGLPPSDFGGLKLMVASPLPAVAVTLVGGSGMRRNIGSPKPPIPTPPNAQDAVAVAKRGKIAVIIPSWGMLP